MLRSLFTGISGLAAHQEMLDVTANNIANVNTTGFKSSTVQFEDTLSQTMATGGANSVAGPTGTPPAYTGIGGSNPQQVGLGVQVVGTTLNFTQGSNQQTGVKTNMLINGDGFFTVMKGGSTYYTRNGAFTVDNAGYLSTPDGATLVDSTGAPIKLPLTSLKDSTGNPIYTDADAWDDFTIAPDGTITGVNANGPVNPTPASQYSPIKIGLATFSNPNGLEKAGNSLYLATTASGQASATGVGTITTGYVEMSNVDLARELTNLIVSERGFQANSKVISTSDEVLQTLVNMTH